ncbi:CHAT domain protein [Ceratobasidium sp. AG-Ba]|nr:CHAT domain protein [Ceratobasidium sp. AG-Ba]
MSVSEIERQSSASNKTFALPPLLRKEESGEEAAHYAGDSLYAFFERLGIAALPEEEGCTDLTSPEGQLDTLISVASRCQDEYDIDDEIDLLNASIECERRALKLSQEAGFPKIERFRALGSSLYLRFRRLRNLADIDEAIWHQNQAAALGSNEHDLYAACLSHLGVLWNERFQRLGRREDIDYAVDYQSQAVQIIPEDHPDRPMHLSNLGNSFHCRFQRLGKLDDLDRAIESHLQAVELTPKGDEGRPSRLSNLGNSWLSRFESLGELADLDRAITYHSQAVQLTPDDHPKKPVRLSNLGNSWLTRFEHSGELADIARAVDLQSQAVHLTLDGHPGRPMYLNNLGDCWIRRFQRLGDLADLERAIEYQTQAIQHTPEDHPRWPRYLNNLGGMLVKRFERLGELADIDRALKYQAQALQTAQDGHPDRAWYLYSLGNSWDRRFERLGELMDIDNAIECQSQSVQLTSKSDPRRPSRLNNLANSWFRRFEYLGELGDIDRAIEYQRQVVQLTPEGNPNKPGRLSSLGNSWLGRFKCLGEVEDLERAIDYQSQAIQLIPDDHLSRLMFLSNLGGLRLIRFERLGEPRDLDDSIECKLKALELTPGDYAYRPDVLKGLGMAYLNRFYSRANRDDLGLALNAFRDGAKAGVFRPLTQTQCAKLWARTSIDLNESPLDGYRTAFQMVPHLVWLGQTVQHRRQVVTNISNLSAEAAAWAISTHKYDLALEWLEQGRSVIWNQTLQLRTPFESVSAADPELGRQFRDIASQLEVASSCAATAYEAPNLSIDLLDRAQNHHTIALRWEELLTRARQLPGFENFLLPRKWRELKKAAKDGPVVVINVYNTRCDALIVVPQREDLVHVPLNKFSHEKLSRMKIQPFHLASRCDDSTDRGFKPDRPQSTLQLLAQLWSDVVGPVLEKLSYAGSCQGDQLPHVTWCATGALSFLPLHAAGLYDGSSLGALDIVVSSYTPTLGALLSHSKQSTDPRSGILLVGQEASPGQASLPKTVDELKAIRRHASSTGFHQLDGASATVNATLSEMKRHGWVHLACHAIQDSQNPAHSAFYLYDGRLTLEEISKQNLPNKGLAFLSACETATGDSRLPDEATHLAAGMLIAGYPSVIATMWSIVDKDGPFIADLVYSQLIADGKMNHKEAARALHQAVIKLREKVGPKEVWRWAPFVHIGV